MADDTQYGISPPQETAIIGRLPGYNTNIDENGQFVSQLLKGLTFIDLIPTTYKMRFLATDENFEDALKTAFAGGETPWIHQPNGKDPQKFFAQILKGMQDGLGLDPSFSKVESIRIIGANDSTFTENLSNMFDGANSLTSMANSVGAKANDVSKGVVSKTVDSLRSMDYSRAMDYFTKNDSGTLLQAIKGSILGVNFAKPGTWNSSQYNSTLSIFIKLVSPSGHEDCIQKNIMQPLLYLMAAGAPMTRYGFSYGMPLIWDVHAHGITRFKLGSIAAMTISRGSFETTFNDKYQPTVVDVRLTIIPLVQDFANEFNPDSSGKLYKNKDSLGVQNAGDIYSGTMNKIDQITGNTGPALKEVKIIQL